jgi:hypothetical protein
MVADKIDEQSCKKNIRGNPNLTTNHHRNPDKSPELFIPMQQMLHIFILHRRVWEGSSSAKPTLELLLHQFAAPPWSWALTLELKRCVCQR